MLEQNDADLLVVEGNPLTDLGVLHRRAGVMVHGKWYTQSDLDRQMEELAAAYQKGAPPVGTANR